MAAPGVAALSAALFAVVQDLLAHEREVRLQEFSSHMANTAFDKHVAFCEAYV